MVCKKVQRGKSAGEIADILEEDPERILDICAVLEKFSPDYDCDKIYEELHKL